MPSYEYSCPMCGSRQLEYRDVDDRNRLPRCRQCELPMRRVYAVQFAPVMQEHWNTSVGKPISSMRQYRDVLKRKSDEASERTGIAHNFQPADPADRETFGVTNDGLKEKDCA